MLTVWQDEMPERHRDREVERTKDRYKCTRFEGKRLATAYTHVRGTFTRVPGSSGRRLTSAMGSCGQWWSINSKDPSLGICRPHLEPPRHFVAAYYDRAQGVPSCEISVLVRGIGSSADVALLNADRSIEDHSQEGVLASSLDRAWNSDHPPGRCRNPRLVMIIYASLELNRYRDRD